jgi:ribosome-associated protein
MHTNSDDELADGRESDPSSRTQRKREAQAVADLAQALVEAKAGVLAKVPVPEEIEADLKLARKISSHIARRRQILFLAKKMRGLDLAPIRAALEPDETAHRQQVAQMHYIERWRDRLLAEGDDALTAFIDAHPQADRQSIRQLIRQATREQAAERAPAAARALYRAVSDAVYETAP